MSRMAFPWLSREPWEKFRRKTSTPASMSCRIIAGESDAGPSVATIFVRRPGDVAAMAPFLFYLFPFGPFGDLERA